MLGILTVMALPDLTPRFQHFYLIGPSDRPIEIVLDYYDEETGRGAIARTWWNPSERNLGGHTWSAVARVEVLRLISTREIPDADEDDLLSLEHRISLQIIDG